VDDDLPPGVFGFLLNMSLPNFFQRENVLDNWLQKAGGHPATDLRKVVAA
jgi:hypothetical protein